jgi:predicted dehydrogenase
MVGAARSNGRRLAMVHNYLPRPDFAAVKRVLDSGVIGQPYVVTLNFLGVRSGPSVPEYQPQWRRDARVSGGGVLIDMVHAVYLAQWLMDEPIRAVNAALGQRQSGTVEDLALCRFEFESGFAMVNVAWGHGPGGIEIMGTEGRLMLFYDGFGTCPFSPPDQLHVYRGSERVAIDDSFLQAYAYPPQASDPAYPLRVLLRNFVGAVEGREELLAPGEHGVLALEAVVGAYASAARQRTVRLPLDPEDAVYQRGIHALLEEEEEKVAV